MDSAARNRSTDPPSLPPLVSTGDPGSFAEKTLRIRLPGQLDQLLGLDPPDPGATAALQALKRRLAGGEVRDLLRERPEVAGAMAPGERADWQREIDAQVGRPWNALPWYFAESLFYLEILVASGHYTPGSPAYRQDPFEPFKRAELSRAHGGISRAKQVLAHTARLSEPAERLAAHLLHALWGNRMDLTFNELIERYGTGGLGGSDELLIDHSPAMARRALAAGRIDLVLDNAGTELVCDLLLAGALLERGIGVVLHVKNSPCYISDTMAKDVHATVAQLAAQPEEAVGRAGRSLRHALEAGDLELRPHWFWNGPLLYPDWPVDIRRELERSDLILFKGDVNYRRLLGDRRWDPETPMEALTGYVPAPFGVLRTLKSEVAVDLPRKTVEQLARHDPEWSVRGRYGVARLRE